jgi:hypothetical protein
MHSASLFKGNSKSLFRSCVSAAMRNGIGIKEI